MLQSFHAVFIYQHVIKPKSKFILPASMSIVPPRVALYPGILQSKSINITHLHHTIQFIPFYRQEINLITPKQRIIDVQSKVHDVIISTKDHYFIVRTSFFHLHGQSIQKPQFIVKSFALDRISCVLFRGGAIWNVYIADFERLILYFQFSLDVSGLGIIIIDLIGRQITKFIIHGVFFFGDDCDPVSSLLTVHHSMIAFLLKQRQRKLKFLTLDFLHHQNINLILPNKPKNARHSRSNRIDIPGSYSYHKR